jgi:hypothetical protein
MSVERNHACCWTPIPPSRQQPLPIPQRREYLEFLLCQQEWGRGKLRTYEPVVTKGSWAWSSVLFLLHGVVGVVKPATCPTSPTDASLLRQLDWYGSNHAGEGYRCKWREGYTLYSTVDEGGVPLAHWSWAELSPAASRWNAARPDTASDRIRRTRQAPGTESHCMAPWLWGTGGCRVRTDRTVSTCT